MHCLSNPWIIMCLRNTKTTYGIVAKTFHWLIFLCIAGMIAVGYIMNDMKMGPDKFRLVGLHKSLGITILTLATLRLLWKATNIAPSLPQGFGPLERFAAHAGHAALYILMFAMPLTGWAMSSAAGFHVSVFGWFTLPDLVGPDKELSTTLRDVHNTLAVALMVMVGLHVIAALLHHFYYRDNVLRRMLPFVKLKDDYAQDIDTLTGR